MITRARKQAGALADLLRKRGAVVSQVPTIEIRAPRSYRRLDAALADITRFDWLILTSVNGVDALFARLQRHKVPPETLRKLKVAAIGPATREALRAHGVPTDVMPQDYVAEAVVRELRYKVKGKRVLLVRARVARDVIPRELRRAGAKVTVVE
ncbi:MAG: uroporphyrinogen-III synthase, partial [Acidobacteriota bacterium]|nr:uroporphyrinogen-III synthase [Acidobacteriota bacterium]